MPNLNSIELLRRLRQGDSQAAAAVFDRYVARLLALARSRIGPKLGRRLDPDDVVQSAYRSFFVHAENEEYVLSQAGDLWRLLASITLNKLHGQAEKHAAARRAIEREEPHNPIVAANAESPEPTPAEIVAIVEQLHLFQAELEPIERTILTARLQGLSIADIAAVTGKSPRTVRRTLSQMQQRLERQLADENIPSRTPRGVDRAADSRAELPFSDFLLERLVGAGGMGKVFRATQRSTGQTVAVKALLKSRQHNFASVEKFLQEAEILSRLRHANIVGFHGVGRFPGGGYFIVMEFVDGADLQSRIAGEPLKIAEAARVVRAAAAAIGYAHEQGVVHGDLKPANILVGADQRVVVTDFGLAQLSASSSQFLTPRWLVGGTRGYIAPEVRDQGSVPSPAADIYGLGALLWALTTGQPPGLNAPTAKFDALIDDIYAKCLAPAPADRYRDADELGAVLDRLLARA